MLLENLVTRRVSEENASKSSLTRRVTKQGHLLLAALALVASFGCTRKPTVVVPQVEPGDNNAVEAPEPAYVGKPEQ